MHRAPESIPAAKGPCGMLQFIDSQVGEQLCGGFPTFPTKRNRVQGLGLATYLAYLSQEWPRTRASGCPLMGFYGYLGLYGNNVIGIMENQMETTIVENQMEKKLENEMETREYISSEFGEDVLPLASVQCLGTGQDAPKPPGIIALPRKPGDLLGSSAFLKSGVLLGVPIIRIIGILRPILGSPYLRQLPSDLQAENYGPQDDATPTSSCLLLRCKYLGYCPPAVTVHIRGPIKGYI